MDGVGVLYTKTGEYSAILKLENPVQKYSANIDNYYEFTNLLTALAQTLGEGYAIHKQDVFIKKKFHDETNDNHEFLSESYFRYFTGRTYTDVQTYLIITQENKNRIERIPSRQRGRKRAHIEHRDTKRRGETGERRGTSRRAKNRAVAMNPG